MLAGMRMGRVVHLFQLGDAVVRIDLRRAQGSMPQQFLNLSQIGAAVHHVGGERMPQHVRTALARNAEESELPPDGPIDLAARDSVSFLC